MVLADRRFSRKRDQLPKWIAQGLSDADLNLSTDMAIANTKQFLRTMAQPVDPKDQEGVSVWSLDDLLKFQREKQGIKQATAIDSEPDDAKQDTDKDGDIKME